MGRKTFYEAFKDANTEENMTLFLDSQFRESVIAAEMEETDAVFFLTYHGDEPIGFTKVRTGHEPPELGPAPGATAAAAPGASDAPDPRVLRALEIERIYVLKQHQDKKAGSFMMAHNIAYAKAQGFTLVWLGVWEHNTSAIRFYERHGFTPFGSHIFIVGTDPQKDILMKKNI